VPGYRGQVLTELDAQDVVAAAGEGDRGLARAAADLEHAPSGRYARQGDYVVEELLGITRAHLVVEQRRPIEGGPQPVSVSHHERHCPTGSRP